MNGQDNEWLGGFPFTAARSSYVESNRLQKRASSKTLQKPDISSLECKHLIISSPLTLILGFVLISFIEIQNLLFQHSHSLPIHPLQFQASPVKTCVEHGD